MSFVKATKAKARARLGLCGPAGAGKTYTALRLATGLGERVAVIDTEHGSASKYADEFDFDVMELTSFHPQNYINGIRDAEKEGYEVLVIDSLSHAWIGKDGILEQVDKTTAKQKTANSFTAWKDVTPIHNQLVEAMLSSKIHLIVTMRSKMEYVMVTDEKGKKVPQKVGMAPVQREGMEYEFDIVGDLDVENNLIISKSRCKALSGEVIKKPGIETAKIIKAWLTDGVDLEALHREETEKRKAAMLEKWILLSGNSDGFEKFFTGQKEKGVSDDAIDTFLSNKIMEKEQNDPNGPINDGQRRAIFATGNSKQLSDDDIRSLVHYFTKKDSIKDLTRGEAVDLLAVLNQMSSEELLSLIQSPKSTIDISDDDLPF